MRKGTVIVTEEKYVLKSTDLDSVEGDSVESVTQQVASKVRFVSQEFDRMDAHSFVQLLITDIERGLKITAIKHLREYTGCSLKDGKDTIDRMIGLGKKFGAKLNDPLNIGDYNPYPD